MTTITTEYGDVHVATSGSGPAVVLLHANPGDHRDYAAVIPPLEEHFTVYAVDWPGYGESPAPTPPTEASAMYYADLLRDLVPRLGVERAALIGNSVGGYAALRLALDRPELVDGLVLANPAGFTKHNVVTRAFCRFKGSERVTRALAPTFPRFYLKRRNDTVAEMLTRAREQKSDATRIAVDAAVWRSFTDPEFDLRARAGAIVAPVLFLWGKKDPNLPIKKDGANARRALPQARFVPVDTGHAAFAEAPDDFLEVALPFLHAVTGAGPARRLVTSTPGTRRR